jgi:hypothetical protein
LSRTWERGESPYISAVREARALSEYSLTKINNQKTRPLMTESAILSKFIRNNAVVVDKTDLIFNLLSSSDCTYFLSRPRRFGKTLLLDTIQNIAEGRRELFKGTHIDRKGAEYAWVPYPVIRISFSGLPSEPEAFNRSLLLALDEISELKGLSLKPAKDASDIGAIIRGVSKLHVGASMGSEFQDLTENLLNVVLLIDEYDFPLLHSLDNFGRIEQLRKILNRFYSTIKKCEGQLRFTFITGISRFSQLSLFSGMNNLTDISLDENYSSICGFTEDEIKLNFHEHIIEALSKMRKVGRIQSDATEETFLEKLKFWYDGYSWDEKTQIYNPYSVMYCLKKSKFSPYWYNSGTSLATYDFKQKPETLIKIIADNFSSGQFEPISDLNSFETEPFLYQTGYLTINKIIIKPNKESYILKCPNNEIAYAIAKDFVKIDNPFPGMKSSINNTFGAFVDAFENSNEEECSKIFSAFLSRSGIHWHSPVEFVYQFLLFILLSIRGFDAQLENTVGDGRADIVYTSPSGFTVLVEIKRDGQKTREKIPALPEPPASGAALPGFREIPSAVKKSMNKRIAEAVNQVISRNYLNAFYFEGETRVCAVAVHGWSLSMFRFFRVDWNAKTIQSPLPRHLVNNENEDASPELRDSDVSPEQD